jgi:hypothetical protein
MDVVAGDLWQIRTCVEALQEEVIVPLDDLLNFRRSDANDYESSEYRPGPDEGLDGYGYGYERFYDDGFDEIRFSCEEFD